MVPDRLFKRHGRWCSESAKDGYVKDSVESRLQISQHLGMYLNIINAFFGPSSVSIINSSQPSVVVQPRNNLCGAVGRVYGMWWEVYFLAFECNELDRK